MDLVFDHITNGKTRSKLDSQRTGKLLLPKLEPAQVIFVFLIDRHKICRSIRIRGAVKSAEGWALFVSIAHRAHATSASLKGTSLINARGSQVVVPSAEKKE